MPRFVPVSQFPSPIKTSVQSDLNKSIVTLLKIPRFTRLVSTVISSQYELSFNLEIRAKKKGKLNGFTQQMTPYYDDRR